MGGRGLWAPAASVPRVSSLLVQMQRKRLFAKVQPGEVCGVPLGCQVVRLSGFSDDNSR